MNAASGAPGDKPLSGSSKLALFFGAGGTILLAYLLSTVSVLLCLALIGFEFVLLIVLARFGLARLMAGVLGAHIALLLVLLRSFWLRKGAEYRIQLQESDAPALFSMLRALCQKAAVEMPREISVEMSVNAWVRLKGYRRGAGRTVLGIGYDLLAGLSQWEMEGVLAHELTHAKLVQRGYKSWMNRGLGRMTQLAQGLNAHVQAYRKANQLKEPAEMLFRATDRLARLAARLVAACSRQDEFDADHGAAALCGPQAIRSSLLKLEPLGQRAARLPWNERVARLQTGEGFSNWLVEEFSSAHFKSADAQGEPNLFFKYSTHPSLHDRLAALPPDASDILPDSTPAIRMLSDPDKVAEMLIAEIQRVVAEEERKDSRRLRRWTRKSRVHVNLQPLQAFGVFLVLIGAAGGLIAWLSAGMSLGLACFIAGAISIGAVSFRFGGYRERLALAVPEFGLLKSAWETRPAFTQEQVKEMEVELKARVASVLHGKKKELALASACYEALSRCDYVRVHIAARFCLQANKQSIEGAVGLAVAGAALGQHGQVKEALKHLHRTTGMTAPSTSLGAGWALLLCGDWVAAEAFLEKRCHQKPGHPTLLLLLAVCQSKRGKLQSALLLARQVCSREPVNADHTKFLIDLLLQAGYLREAQEYLRRLQPAVSDDVDLILMMVRVDLLLRDLIAADRWTELLKQKNVGAHLLVRLGQFHELARQYAKATAFYSDALASGFYPEALLGLARLDAQARNKEQARTRLLAALNVERPLAAKATGPLPLFHPILNQLLALQAPVAGCRAWIATLNGGKAPPGLESKSILVYASSREQAEQSLYAIFAAMQPTLPPPMPSTIGWAEGRQEQQPDGPVRSGVQGVLN